MQNNAIDIRYTHFSSKLSDRHWVDCLYRLPEAIQQKITRYTRWQDRQAALFGKLLLLECLKEYDYLSDCLDDILFGRYGRPYLNRNVDFNIAHSGEYAICAITNAGRVGVDIEKIKTIDLSDFEQSMTAEQWKNIQAAANRHKTFYQYWTIKESALKADGRGLSFPLSEISTNGGKAKLNGSFWYLREINIAPDYSCHLATNIEHPEISVKEISFIGKGVGAFGPFGVRGKRHRAGSIELAAYGARHKAKGRRPVGGSRSVPKAFET